MNNVEVVIKDRINKRVSKAFLEFIYSDLNIKEFYIGGNSLNRATPSDIDIYPVKKEDIYIFNTLKSGNFNNKLFKLITFSKNAITFSFEKTIYQACNYYHDSLIKLVESFDFAHIKIGAKISIDSLSNMNIIPYISKDWEEAHLLESTYFTKSEYPLSSLIRAFKYYKREDFSGNSHIYSILSILNSIITRGFNGYSDFKNQLDAVDLGLVPEDLKESTDILYNLFTILNKEKANS